MRVLKMKIQDVIKMTIEANSPEELEAKLKSQAETMTPAEMEAFARKMDSLSADDLVTLVFNAMQREYSE